MNEFLILIVALVSALAMGMLARSGVEPNLRAAIRTTFILALGGCVASRSTPEIHKALTIRSWILLLLSALVIALAWILWFRSRRQPQTGPALMDRLNVAFAGVFAAVLFYDRTDSMAWLSGLGLIAGAFILSRGRF